MTVMRAECSDSQLQENRMNGRDSESHGRYVIKERLIASGVGPRVQAELPDTAVRISRALLAGGLSVIEVVLRTDDALGCLWRR